MGQLRGRTNFPTTTVNALLFLQTKIKLGETAKQLSMCALRITEVGGTEVRRFLDAWQSCSGEKRWILAEEKKPVKQKRCQLVLKCTWTWDNDRPLYSRSHLSTLVNLNAGSHNTRGQSPQKKLLQTWQNGSKTLLLFTHNFKWSGLSEIFQDKSVVAELKPYRRTLFSNLSTVVLTTDHKKNSRCERQKYRCKVTNVVVTNATFVFSKCSHPVCRKLRRQIRDWEEFTSMWSPACWCPCPKPRTGEKSRTRENTPGCSSYRRSTTAKKRDFCSLSPDITEETTEQTVGFACGTQEVGFCHWKTIQDQQMLQLFSSPIIWVRGPNLEKAHTKCGVKQENEAGDFHLNWSGHPLVPEPRHAVRGCAGQQSVVPIGSDAVHRRVKRFLPSLHAEIDTASHVDSTDESNATRNTCQSMPSPKFSSGRGRRCCVFRRPDS